MDDNRLDTLGQAIVGGRDVNILRIHAGNREAVNQLVILGVRLHPRSKLSTFLARGPNPTAVEQVVELLKNLIDRVSSYQCKHFLPSSS